MSHFTSPISCGQFEAHVSDHVDRTLSASDAAAMDAHVAHCTACTALHADVAAIVADASQLPLLSPSRDLWSGIAERLDTPVVAIGTTGTHRVRTRRTVSFQMFAAAAMLIVAASSGATYLITRANPAESVTAPVAANQSAQTPAPAPATAGIAEPSTDPPVTTPDGTPTRRASVTSNPLTGTVRAGEPTRSRYAANDGSVELVYEREITAMRRIVDDRLGDLDSTTVVEIERNLRIIDKAISDSRRALQNDPRSRFLSSQLDRALETKLGVLRRIALL
ncbi:MAG: zf-HC2 domain-containing protein [Phycisphaerae bacterium]|nr:zf-HC2 domain-containing protein [Gemmatimonadaceae bacterium]